MYLDPEGKEEASMFVTGDGHLMSTTKPHGLIHRIVYYSWNPTAKVEGMHVHHLDENPRNNALSNLSLLTASEHRRLHNTKRTGEKNPMYGKFGAEHHNSKPVRQYTKEGVFVAEYASTHEASRMTGVNQSSISMCCNHKPRHNTAGGFIWRFKDDPLSTNNNLELL